MASDAKLIVDLEARVAAFERQLARGKKAANDNFKSIESRAATMSSKVSRSLETAASRFSGAFKGAAFGFAAGAFGGFSVDAAERLVDASTKISNALKVTGLAGADLTKVYDSLFASAQRQAAPLATLVELYSRAALQQKELGVSSEQLLKFTDNVALALRVQGADASTASGSLLQLAQALGSGVVHAQEFNSILEGTPTIAQAVAAGLKDAGGSVAALRTLVVNGKVSSSAFFAAFEAGADTLQGRVAGAELTVSQAFTRLQNVMIDVAGKFNDSTAAGTALANFLSGPLTQAVQEIGSVFSGVANGPIGQFVGLIDEAVDSLLKASEAFGKATGLSKIGESLGAKSYSQVTNPPLDITVSKPAQTTKPVSLADYPVGPSKGAGGSGRAHQNSYERETAQIASINALTEAQAALNPLINDYGAAVETARAKQDLLNAAQKAGVKVTPELQAQIDALAAKYGTAAAASAKLADAQDDIRRKAEDNLNAARGVVQGVVDDLRAGKSAAEIFADALGKIANKIENDLLDAIFNLKSAGGGGGGILGAIFGGIGSLFGGGGGGRDPWAGMRFASGTNFAPGGLSLVGERGPELMNVPRGAQIIPNPQTMAMLRGPKIPSIQQRGGGGTVVNVTLAPVIDNRGASTEAVVKTQQALAQLKAELPLRVVDAVRKANKSNVKL